MSDIRVSIEHTGFMSYDVRLHGAGYDYDWCGTKWTARRAAKRMLIKALGRDINDDPVLTYITEDDL